MRIACLCVCAAAVLGAGCGDGTRAGRDSGPPGDAAGMDAGRRDAGPPEMCTGDGDCDDGHACTLDSCAVGNVCRHVTIDAMCAEGEVCTVTMGCTSGCTEAADCDDGDFCNGAERCIANDCFMGTPADCDDGNACTADACDPEINGCVYETLCDAGPGGGDGGLPVEDFDPARHYAGSFLVAPAPSQECLGSTYSFSMAGFTSGGSLTVRAGTVTLTGPTPTDETFTASTSRPGCADYQLDGTFSDSNNFSARWRVTMNGTCAGICRDQDIMIVGVRTEF